MFLLNMYFRCVGANNGDNIIPFIRVLQKNNYRLLSIRSESKENKRAWTIRTTKSIHFAKNNK